MDTHSYVRTYIYYTTTTLRDLVDKVMQNPYIISSYDRPSSTVVNQRRQSPSGGVQVLLA